MKWMLLAPALAALAMITGCGKNEPTPVNARERKVDLKPGARTIVTRWKEADFKGRGYGMIIEQDGQRIQASLYTLDEGEGMVIREKTAQGRYFSERREIAFPLNGASGPAADNWIASGGPQLVVSFAPGSAATNVTGTLKDPSRAATYQFVKIESVGPTYNPVPTANSSR